MNEMTVETELPTGRLSITIERNDTGLPVDDVFRIAARANPRRGFLIVSRLIGRHMPTAPATMRRVMEQLATRIPADLPGPLLFVGMAETAVGLGQGVHEAWCRMTGRADALFLQSTRQTNADMPVWARFEEGHSHASSHLLHQGDDAAFQDAQSLVMVDDECSTGRTFVAAGTAIDAALGRTTTKIEAVVTDWSPREGGRRVSLMSGKLAWSASGTVPPSLEATANSHGKTRRGAAPGRTGYRTPPPPPGAPVVIGPRVLVLSDGENGYDALLVAEQIANQGHDVAIQSITRSPALIGHALDTALRLDDAHGSGADCFVYNLGSHRPDDVVVVVEKDGGQAAAVAIALGMPPNV